LEADYSDGVNPWSYDQLIEYLEYQYGLSYQEAKAVVDAVEYDWGNSEQASGTTREPSGSSGSGTSSSGSTVGSACVSGERVCEAAKWILITSGQGVNFTREGLIQLLMGQYGATRAKAEAIIDAIGFTNWAGQQQSRDLVEFAKYHVDNFYFSRLALIEAFVNTFGEDRSASIAAIDSLNVNWSQEAKQQAESILNQRPVSFSVLIYLLVDELKFLESEARAAEIELGVNWYEQAEKMARLILRQQSPPCNFSYDSMIDVLVNDEYFVEDQAHYGLYDFVTFDENENPTWLVCGP
jgi:hypothetical protein